MTTSSPPAPGVRDRPLRIACVYRRDHRPNLALSSMAEIRFFRMAEALARRGYAVDLVLNRHQQPRMLDNNLREVPFELVRWETVRCGQDLLPSRIRDFASRKV